MKKRIFGILAAFLIISALFFVVKISLFGNNHFWKYSADYDKFANEFNVVKDYIASEFPAEEDKWLSLSKNNIGEITLYDPDTGNYLVIPENIVSALSSLRNNAFPDKDSNLDTIRIQDERISFCISSGEYALVYSPNAKPKWVNSPNEDSKVKVKTIQDGWYHVTKVK